MKKMNKKGFTLVELLAVIAILAILILLVTPNILKMFNEGKESIFVQQAQRVMDASNNKYMSVSLKKPGSYVFTNKVQDDESKTSYPKTTNLNLTSNAIDYCVEMNNEGNITFIHVSDATYSIKIANDKGVKLDDISKPNESDANKYKELKTNGTDADYAAVGLTIEGSGDTAKSKCNR